MGAFKYKEDDNIYFRLTREFNQGRVRAILSSGQAVVYYRLSMQSKDCDWIIRGDGEATSHILGVLSRRGAKYRFGAPLDGRWLAHGWSSHFEFETEGGERIRTDFVSIPPRLSPRELEREWKMAEGKGMPVLSPAELAAIKKTCREKDYPVIGEIARKIQNPVERLLHSRSPEDIMVMRERFPEDFAAASQRRPALAEAPRGIRHLRRALDEERWDFIDRDRERLREYQKAAAELRRQWPQLGRYAEMGIEGFHEHFVYAAEKILPFNPFAKGETTKNEEENTDANTI